MPRRRFITHFGETRELHEWAALIGVDRRTLSARINSGMSLDVALMGGDRRSSQAVKDGLKARVGAANPNWQGGSTPEKKAAYARKWRAENAEAVRDREYQRRFGITLEQYDQMLRSQRGVCAICQGKCKRGRLSVDHCHRTGRVRGLLCRACNLLLGAAGDSRKLLKRAEAYLAGEK